ncbi:MAG: hypothetical protein PUJ16_05020 [Campylobacteraceae bacterium]|nr:hypothetical protein [Campylobacteraceae bacterium]
MDFLVYKQFLCQKLRNSRIPKVNKKRLGILDFSVGILEFHS